VDDRAFLQAIMAAPDDDAPRLIYADWLDEHLRCGTVSRPFHGFRPKVSSCCP
jgi:uncharacterized protein (TIGR02996 family)